MPKQLHPHTHAVQAAARHLDSMAKLLHDGPKFMEGTKQARLRERHAALDNAASDIQALRGTLPLHMLEKLHKLDEP